jgi:hypothetical protein
MQNVKSRSEHGGYQEGGPMNPRAPEGERSGIGTARSRVPPLVFNGTTAQSLETFIPGRRSRR